MTGAATGGAPTSGPTLWEPFYSPSENCVAVGHAGPKVGIASSLRFVQQDGAYSLCCCGGGRASIGSAAAER